MDRIAASFINGAVSAGTLAARARAQRALEAFLGDATLLDGIEEGPGRALTAVLRYLARRFTNSGGRQRVASEPDRRFLSASALRQEVSLLRSNSYASLGHIPWNPVSGEGNPFLSDEVGSFVTGATRHLLDNGIVPGQAAEATASEVARLVCALRGQVDLYAAHPKSAPVYKHLVQAIVYQQELVFVLCGFVWGDRIGDVVDRDFDDVVLVGGDCTQEQWDSITAGGRGPLSSMTDAGRGTRPHPPGVATALVRYAADKGAKLTLDPLLRNRIVAHPVLRDNMMEPSDAIGRLAELYALLAEVEGTRAPAGMSVASAMVGPVIRAFPNGNPRASGGWNRINKTTFTTRVNAMFRTAGGGGLQHLTTHSFRRGAAQHLALHGAAPLAIAGFGRWRQLSTMYRYLVPARPAAVPQAAPLRANAAGLFADLGAHATASVAAASASGSADPAGGSAIALLMGPASAEASRARQAPSGREIM